MKKYYSILLAVMVLCLTACNSNAAQLSASEENGASEVNSEPTQTACKPADEAVKFLYQTFYSAENLADNDYIVGRYSLGYSNEALNKFKELGIESDLNYPRNASLEEGNDYYQPYYSDSLNSLLKKITAALETTDNFESVLMMSGDFEGDAAFNLDISKVEEVSPERIIVTATENPECYDLTYVLIKQNGKWFIDDIYNYRENGAMILGD